jgi:hypothetical protein
MQKGKEKKNFNPFPLPKFEPINLIVPLTQLYKLVMFAPCMFGKT